MNPLKHHGIVYTKGAANVVAAHDAHGPVFTVVMYTVEINPALDIGTGVFSLFLPTLHRFISLKYFFCYIAMSGV